LVFVSPIEQWRDDYVLLTPDQHDTVVGIYPPPGTRTDRGIGVGSTAQDVRKAYAGTAINFRVETRHSSSDDDYRSWVKLDDVAWSVLSLPFTIAGVFDKDLYTGRIMIKPSDVIELTRAVDYYTQCAQNNAAFRGWAYCCLGIVRQESGELEKALDDYARAIALGSEYFPANAAAFTNRASIREQWRDYERAQQDFDEAVKLQPQSAILHYNLAHCLYSKGDRSHALNHYDQAIRFDQDDPLSLNNRAVIYFEKGEHQLALADLELAAKKDMGIVIAHANRAAILEALGRDAQAAAAYTDVIQQDHSRRYRDYAQLRREQLISKIGQTENAQENYEIALKGDPAYQYARFRLVEILLSRGERARANQEFSKMPQGAYVSACLRHAELLMLMGDHRKAAEILDKGLQMEPGNSSLLSKRSALKANEPSHFATQKKEPN
jgi:tetratricopeptide (TPR) repeat protein